MMHARGRKIRTGVGGHWQCVHSGSSFWFSLLHHSCACHAWRLRSPPAPWCPLRELGQRWPKPWRGSVSDYWRSNKASSVSYAINRNNHSVGEKALRLTMGWTDSYLFFWKLRSWRMEWSPPLSMAWRTTSISNSPQPCSVIKNGSFLTTISHDQTQIRQLFFPSLFHFFSQHFFQI